MIDLNSGLKKYYPNISINMSLEALELLTLSTEKNSVITIISNDQHFLFGCNKFETLFHQKNVFGKTHNDFTENKKIIDFYIEQDEMVLSTAKILSTTQDVAPKGNKKFIKSVHCTRIPLYLNSDKPNAILGISTPENKLISLSPETILKLNNSEIQNLLNRRRYGIYINKEKYIFSKREIHCFIELLKGKHAGEIAADLNLQQNTVEFYIKNMKTKCGVSRKSGLIAFFIENNILKQIFV